MVVCSRRPATAEVCFQLALALRDEVADLEAAGLGVIQVDEPALREGLPLREVGARRLLRWAVDAFRLATAVLRDETQIHTHMCYAEFGEILDAVVQMDADVISMEAARLRWNCSQAFAGRGYPNDIGPGIYDIHSPRAPGVEEMESLIRRALERSSARTTLGKSRLWAEDAALGGGAARPSQLGGRCSADARKPRGSDCCKRIGKMTFSLEAVPPFRLDLTAWAIRRRPENLMDWWDGRSYGRVLAIDGDAVRVTVTQSGGKTSPQLHVVATAAARGTPKKAKIAAAIERLLGVALTCGRFTASPRASHDCTNSPPISRPQTAALSNGI